MSNNKVAVLLSTYNGEKYIEQQIESILDQSYRNIELFIRDDGSTDHTVDLIHKARSVDSRVVFVNENNIRNIGVTRSFLSLLKFAKADYYMFSDQDDFWKREKIQKTLDLMRQEHDQSIPLCAHTDLQIVNSELKGSSVMNGNDVWHDFLRLMFGNCVTGCTMMINDPLKKMINYRNSDDIYMHDWWIALIAAAFGKIVYLNEPTILYRQHGDNVVGEAEKSKFKRFFNRRMDIENMLNVFSISSKFKKVYGNKLDGTIRDYIFAYSNVISKSNFFNDLKLLIHYPPKRKTIIGKLFFAYLVLTHYRKVKQLQ